MIENKDYVICKICGIKMKLLARHIKKDHNLTKIEYMRLYPNSQIICKNAHINYSKRTIKYNLMKYGPKEELIKENIDHVVCQICGAKKKFLATHVLRKHNIKIKKYKKLYPNKKTVCKEYSDKVTNIREANGFYKRHHSEESKEKQRNSDYHKSPKKTWEERFGKEEADKRKENISQQKKYDYKFGKYKIWSVGLTKKTDHRLYLLGQKISKTRALNVNEWHPNSKWYKQGYYINKFGTKEFYHSSWELKIMKQLDNDDMVIFWTKKHKIVLPYYKENIKNRIGITHDIESLGHYVSDFYVERNNQKYLIECKPKNFWNTVINQNKFKSAFLYCIKKDIIFIVCEDTILDFPVLRNIKEPLDPELDLELKMEREIALV